VDSLGKSLDRLTGKGGESQTEVTPGKPSPKRVSKLKLQRTEILSGRKRSARSGWQPPDQADDDTLNLKHSLALTPVLMSKIEAREQLKLAEQAKQREKAEADRLAVMEARRSLPKIADTHTPVVSKDEIRIPGWDVFVVGVARPGKLLSTPGLADQVANGEWVIVFLDVRNATDMPQSLFDYNFQFVSHGGSVPNCSSPERGGCRYYISGLSEARGLYQEKRGLAVLNANYDKKEFPPGALLRTALVYDLPVNSQKLTFGAGISYIDLSASMIAPATVVQAVAREEISVTKLEPAQPAAAPAALPIPEMGLLVDAEEVARLRARAEADKKARTEEAAKLKARAEAEEQVRLETEKRARAEEEAKLKARAEAEERIRLEAEKKARAEEAHRQKLRAEAEEKARLDAEAQRAAKVEADRIALEAARRLLPPIRDAHTALHLKQPLQVPGWELSIIGVSRPGKILATSGASEQMAENGDWVVVFLEARNTSETTQPLFDYEFQFLSDELVAGCRTPESGTCRHFVSGAREARGLYQAERGLTVLNENYDKKHFPAGTLLRTALVYDLPLHGQKLNFGTGASRVEVGTLLDVPLDPAAAARDREQTRQAAARAEEEARLAAEKAAEQARAAATQAEEQSRRAAEEEAKRKAQVDADHAAIEVARRALPAITEAYTPIQLKSPIQAPGWDISLIGVSRPGKTLRTRGARNQDASNGDWVVVFLEASNATGSPLPLFDYEFQFLVSGPAAPGCNAPEPEGCRYPISGLNEARGLYQKQRGLTVLNTQYDKRIFPSGTVLRTALVYDLPLKGTPLSFGIGANLVNLGTLQEVPTGSQPHLPQEAATVTAPQTESGIRSRWIRRSEASPAAEPAAPDAAN
jgi:chemotaxis protein histidine kinase CheA